MVPGLAKYVLPCSIEYGKPNLKTQARVMELILGMYHQEIGA